MTLRSSRNTLSTKSVISLMKFPAGRSCAKTAGTTLDRARGRRASRGAATDMRSSTPATPTAGRRACARSARAELGLAQLTACSDRAQLVVGDRVPQEERQPRSELEIRDAIGAGRDADGRFLRAIEEVRACEDAGERELDASLEGAAVRAAVMVVRQALGDVLFREWPTKARIARFATISSAHGSSSSAVRG